MEEERKKLEHFPSPTPSPGIIISSSFLQTFTPSLQAAQWNGHQGFMAPFCHCFLLRWLSYLVSDLRQVQALFNKPN